MAKSTEIKIYQICFDCILKYSFIKFEKFAHSSMVKGSETNNVDLLI